MWPKKISEGGREANFKREKCGKLQHAHELNELLLSHPRNEWRLKIMVNVNGIGSGGDVCLRRFVSDSRQSAPPPIVLKKSPFGICGVI